jgi:hypothetical protein
MTANENRNLGIADITGDILWRVKTLEQAIGDPKVVGVYPSDMVVTSIQIGGIQYGVGAPSIVTNVLIHAATFYTLIEIVATWGPPATGPVAGYTIIMAEKDATSGVYTITESQDVNYPGARFTNLKPNTTYGFKIYANAPDSSQGDVYPSSTTWQDVITNPDDSIPAVPNNVHVASSVTSLMVTWDDNTEPDVANGVGYYQVEYDTTNTFTSGSQQTRHITGTLMTIGGLTGGVAQYIRVQAVDSSGNLSGWSGTVSATPGSSTGSGAPTDGSPPPTAGAPTVYGLVGALFAKWTPVGNPDPVTYDVYVGTTSTFTVGSGNFAGSTPATAIVLKDINGTALASATNYYVKVVARDADGSSSASPSGGPIQLASFDPTSIPPGTITADMMVVGTITAASGIIGSLDAGVITTGILSADRIAAGTITANKLTISALGPNIIPNGNLTDGSPQADGWTNSGTITHTMATDSTSPTGGKVARFVNPGNNTSGAITSRSFGVPPGKRLTIYGDMLSSVAAGVLKVELILFKSDGTQSSVDPIMNVFAPTLNRVDGTGVQTVLADNDNVTGTIVLMNSVMPAAAGWYRLAAAVVLPHDAITAKLRLTSVARTGGTSSNDQFSAWSAGVQIEGAGISANSITSDMISTAGLDAGTIKFGTMNGDRIQTDTLDAGAITTSTLDAATITIGESGRLFIGGEAGSVIIDSSGIHAYDGTSTEVFNLTEFGDLTLTGIIKASEIIGSDILGGTFVTESTDAGRAHIEMGTNNDLTSIRFYGATANSVGNTSGYPTKLPGSLFINDAVNDTVTLQGATNAGVNPVVMKMMSSDGSMSMASSSMLFRQYSGDANTSGVAFEFRGNNSGDIFYVDGASAHFAGLMTVDQVISTAAYLNITRGGGGTFWMTKSNDGNGVAYNDDTDRVYIYTAGASRVYCDATGWHSSSSQRFKSNITDITIPADLVDQVQPVTYTPVDSDMTAVGVIAEQLAANPDLAQYVGWDAEGLPDGVAYDRLAMAMALSLNSKISDLQERIDSLTSK